MNDQNKCPKGGYEVYVNVFEENFDKAQWQTPQGEWLGLPDQESYNYVRDLCLYSCNFQLPYYEKTGPDHGGVIDPSLSLDLCCVYIQ